MATHGSQRTPCSLHAVFVLTTCGRGIELYFPNGCRHAGNGGSKPKTVETDNQGTPVQVNLGIHAQGCCSNSGTGLFEEAPEIVFKTGLQRHVYEQWIRWVPSRQLLEV